ncbi:MAG: hypothetical protein LBI42_02850 [Chitinispirillales bacterium]|jgi:hypothetical protein|nr:hypothetical protein [Chitinispirillales bacterium]
MGANVDVRNPIEVRKAALRVLKKHLGPEITKAFMGQTLYRHGDYTKEKYEMPEPSFDELTAELWEEEAKLEKEEAGDEEKC